MLKEKKKRFQSWLLSLGCSSLTVLGQTCLLVLLAHLLLLHLPSEQQMDWVMQLAVNPAVVLRLRFQLQRPSLEVVTQMLLPVAIERPPDHHQHLHLHLLLPFPQIRPCRRTHPFHPSAATIAELLPCFEGLRASLEIALIEIIRELLASVIAEDYWQ
jgi:hypothetical protein